MQTIFEHIKRIFSGIKVIFFPELCVACGRKLVAGETMLCTVCRVGMPLTDDHKGDHSHLRERFTNHFDPVWAVSFFYYVHGSHYSRIILNIKFKGCATAAVGMGRLFGRYLADECPQLCRADLLVPLPLSRERMARRGFNQSELIARGMGEQTGLAVETRAVSRVRYRQAQSHIKSRAERLYNVDGVFKVTRPELLRGRHIILVDDVVTTGSTLTSCAKAILEAVPDCRISIAALASTPKTT
ncbi:MAG: ComF family protein [Rikenellaceae bacterium]|nr:ComF family protein [Rikenellaceae bacterium]MDE7134138.1 ComF family protein [Rikenellaceae bacterium]MDE7356621.1 ComF family protein [Rikenellaceae bacterium]